MQPPDDGTTPASWNVRALLESTRTPFAVVDYEQRLVLPRVSHEIIADMVGSTRSRVNAFMGTFQTCGFLEEDNGVLYINPALLPIVYDGHKGVSNGTSSDVFQALRFEQRRLISRGT